MIGQSESSLLAQIREAVALTGKIILWRNNTGKLQDVRGRWVTFGLGLGGADLVGLVRGSGRFFALEVKRPDGRVSQEQVAWARVVTEAGGFVRTVRSVEEALAAVRDAA